MAVATLLDDEFDPSALPPGLYVVSSASRAYPAAVFAAEAGDMTVVGEHDTAEGELIRVLQVRGARRNPEEDMGGMRTVRLGPEYFQAPLKEYAEWKVKWWREVVQNSVDAGATEITLTVRPTGDADGTIVVSAEDNGKGMDQATLVDKFLVLGATTKIGAAGKTGGFGKAKELILLPWVAWRIVTGDVEAVGAGAEYQLKRVASAKRGVRVEVIMPADNATTIAAAMEFLGRSHLPGVTVTLVSENEGARVFSTEKAEKADVANMSLVEDGERYAVYFRQDLDASTYNAFVRVNGLYMFSIYVGTVPGQVYVELKGSSIDLLTSNRDGFRDRTLSNDISRFVERLAKDTTSALKSKKGHIRKKYGSGQKFRAEVVRPSSYDMTVSTEVGPGKHTLTPEAVKDCVDQFKAVEHDRRATGEAAPGIGGEQTLTVDLATDLLSNLVFAGDRHLENALKQLAWEPDFVLISEIDNFKVPKKFIPETMTARVVRFAKVWAETCRWVLMQLGCGRPYSVGFIFSPDTLACYLQENGEHWLLINPYRGRKARETMDQIHHGYAEPSAVDELETYQVTDRDSFKHLYAAAVHECTHFADDVMYHDEAFASALTENFAKTADGMGQYRKLLAATAARRGGSGEPRENPSQPIRVQPIDYDARHDPKTMRFCIQCQKDLKPTAKCRAVVITPDMEAVHPGDLARLGHGTRYAAYLIGMDCAAQLGMEWTFAATDPVPAHVADERR